MRWKIFSILAIVLFVSGCAFTIPSSGKKESSSEEESPFTGKLGLVLSFYESRPPSKTSPMSRFQISLMAHNQGAMDVENGKVRLGGISQAITLEENKERTFGKIRGKYSYDKGDSDTIKWYANVEEELRGLPKNEVLNAKVCYESSMILDAPVCVRPRDGSEYIIKGQCILPTEESINNGKGQGSPIVAYEITEDHTKASANDKHKFYFKIKFKDEGKNGNVVALGTSDFEQCAFGRNSLEKVELTIEEANLVGAGNLNCKSRGADNNVLIMLDGHGILYCETEEEFSTGHYSVDLYIKINYGYTIDISKNIKIEEEKVAF